MPPTLKALTLMITTTAVHSAGHMINRNDAVLHTSFLPHSIIDQIAQLDCEAFQHT